MAAKIDLLAAVRPPRDTELVAQLRQRIGAILLSDEQTVTRIGYPTLLYKIRSGPGKRLRSTGRLRFYTEDRAPENYLVLRSKLDANGQAVAEDPRAARPERQQGLGARATRCRCETLTTPLEIDKRALKAWLPRTARGSGARASASARPAPRRRAGRFWVRERPAQPRRQPGLRAVRRSAPPPTRRLSDWPGGGVVGIHGTDAARPDPRPRVTRLHPRAQLRTSCSSSG